MPRVLVVDQDSTTLEFVTSNLRIWGLTTASALAASGAVSLCKESTDKFDLLVTNMRIGAVDGLDLARRVRVLYPSIPVLFMSSDPTACRLLLDAGWPCLLKPVRLGALKAAVMRFLSSEILD